MNEIFEDPIIVEVGEILPKIVDYLQDREIDGYNDTHFLRLKQSIQERGVSEPIILARLGNDKFELIAGRRRIRTIKEINASQKKKILTLPVRILKEDVSYYDRYLIAYESNKLVKSLSDQAQIESISYMISSIIYPDVFEKYIVDKKKINRVLDILKKDVTDMLLYEKCQQQNKEYAGPLLPSETVEQKLSRLTKLKETINEVANRLKVEPDKLISLINLQQLNEYQKRLLSENIFSTDELKKVSVKRFRKELFDISNVLQKGLLKKQENYDMVVEILRSYNKKLSDFYNIKNIETFSDENAKEWNSKFAEELKNGKLGIAYMIKDKIFEAIEAHKRQKEQSPKVVARQQIKAFLKRANEEQLKRVLELIAEVEDDNE